MVKKKWGYLIHDKRITLHHIVNEYLDKSERELSVKDQCELLGIGRASAYYQMKPVSVTDLDLMNRIDKLHTDFPFYGARKIATALTNEVNFTVGRKRARTLMEEMGIEAIYPKPNLSFNNDPHATFPYLLKGVAIINPNQVWRVQISRILK